VSNIRKVVGFIDSEILRAVVIGVDFFNRKDKVNLNDSLNELKELSKAAGIEVVHTFTQKKDRPSPSMYIGTGKLDEIKMIARAKKAEIIIFDDELSGIQIRNLEEYLDLEIIDRASLILDIFANRAKTKEGKLQVELARLKYEMPRIIGLGHSLSRQGGGIGTRGLGEKKLEIDKRVIGKRIHDVEEALKKVRTQRETQRAKRKVSALPTVALVGYTNSGKSTLMNKLMNYGSGEMGTYSPAKDMLFATLDPFHRKIKKRSPTGER